MKKSNYKIIIDYEYNSDNINWKSYYEVKAQIKSLQKLHKKYNISEVTTSVDTLNKFLKNIRIQIKSNKIYYTLEYKHNKKLQHMLKKSLNYSFNIVSLFNTTNKSTKPFHSYWIEEQNHLEVLRMAKSNILASIKKYREVNKKIDSVPKRYTDNTGMQHNFTMICSNNHVNSIHNSSGNINSQIVKMTNRGGVHSTNNTIFQIYILKQNSKIFESKIPTTSSTNNYVGIELEFFCQWDKNKLAHELIIYDLAKYCQLKTDSSIRPTNTYISHELCILVTEREYKEIIHKLCIILKTADAQVNKSCGFHVHLDMRNRKSSIDTIYSNLVSAQPILYAMNPKSRRDGQYSKTTTTKIFKDASSDRYKGINAEATKKHNTIEIRIHSGTVSENKIINWIDLLLSIINEKEIQRTTRFLRTFLKNYKINIDLANYITERINKFTEDNGEIEEAA